MFAGGVNLRVLVRFVSLKGRHIYFDCFRSWKFVAAVSRFGCARLRGAGFAAAENSLGRCCGAGGVSGGREVSGWSLGIDSWFGSTSYYFEFKF